MDDASTPTPPAPAPPAAPPPPSAPAAPPTAAAPPVYDRKSPGLAGFLSMFPGLGHLYLGLYERAFAFAGAFCLLIFFNSHGRISHFTGPVTAFVWFFAIIDAVRQAKAINAGHVSEGGLAPAKQLARGSQGTAGLTWGVILVGLGSLWLIDRYVDIDWSFMERWGAPVAFILLGVVLIASNIAKKRKEHENGVGMPPRSQ